MSTLLEDLQHAIESGHNHDGMDEDERQTGSVIIPLDDTECFCVRCCAIRLLANLPIAESTQPPYDSTNDTKAHISRVRWLLQQAAACLEARGNLHDESKLHSPEKEMFDEVGNRLRGLTYGSADYKASLAELKPALDHHYAHNSHHPEHYENGIEGMSLLDLIEMLMDWKAASERHENGSMSYSLSINKARFKISDQLAAILENTAREMGLL